MHNLHGLCTLLHRALAARRLAQKAALQSLFLLPQVDIAVVEAGLGGARDATNMFSPHTLKLAIITAIGLEHQRALGETLQVMQTCADDSTFVGAKLPVSCAQRFNLKQHQ